MVLSNPDSRVLYDAIHENPEPSPVELPPGNPINPDPSFPSTSRPTTPTPYSSTAHPSAHPSVGANFHGQSDLDNATARDAYSVPPTADYIPPTPFTQYYREHVPEHPPETPTTPVPQTIKQQTDDQGDDSGTKTTEVTPKAAPVGLPEQQSRGESPVTERRVETQEAENPPETPLTKKPADANAGATFQQPEPSSELSGSKVVEPVADPPVDEIQRGSTTPEDPVGNSELEETGPINVSADSEAVNEAAAAAAASTNVVEPTPEESTSKDPTTAENDAQELASQPETSVEGKDAAKSPETAKTELQPQT